MTNFLLLFVALFLISILRIVLNSNNYIINIIASINVISLLYVAILVFESAEKRLKKMLERRKELGAKVKNRMFVTYVKQKRIFYIFIIIFSIVYTVFFANNVLNDIIGLIALFFSIESKYLCGLISKLYFNKK